MRPNFLNYPHRRAHSSRLKYRSDTADRSCELQSLIDNYNKLVFRNFCSIKHSSFIIISVIISIIIYCLQIVDVFNRYSILFNIIILVIIFTATFFIFYFQNKIKLEGLRLKMEEKNLNVRHDGISKVVKMQNVSCGDIIKLNTGDEVPTDLGITSCCDLKVKNYTLSNKEIDSDFASHPTDANVFKSKNILFQGSKIITGNMSGVVINEYNNTFLNQIINQIKQIFITNGLSKKFTFRREIYSLINLLFYCWFGLMFLCFICLILTGYIQVQLIYIFLGLGACLLTPTIMFVYVICLSIAKRHFHNCNLKHPEFSLTLGQLNVLFVNDTSMFCEDQLTISKMWLNGFVINEKETTSDITENKIFRSSAWTALTRAAVLCNETIEYVTEESHSQVRKIPNIDVSYSKVDESLIKSFGDCESIQKWGGSLFNYIQNNTNISGIKYDSSSNCKYSIHKLNDGDSRLLLIVRGDVNDILNCCNTVLIEGKEENLDKWKENILQQYGEMRKYSKFVRAFCDFRLNPAIFTPHLEEINEDLEHFIPRKDLRFIGIVSFTETFKPQILSSIEKCKLLGIRLVFVSENQEIPIIALSKAKDLNEYEIASADAINFWEAKFLRDVINNKTLIITDTERKLIQDLITFCQWKKEKVGVIESDVNGIDNLLLANIGIIAQSTSNNLSKQFADICVQNDDFVTLVENIEKSKKIFEMFNILLSVIHFPKIPLIFGFMCFSIFGVPLVINLNVILLLEISLLPPTILLFYGNFQNFDYIIRHSKMLNLGFVVQIGCIELIGSAFSYIVVMTLQGFWPRRLLMIRNVWYLSTINDLTDSYGQEWTYAQRMDLNVMVSSAVFITIIILQFTAIITVISNIQSIFSQCLKKLPFILLILLCLSIPMSVFGISKLNILELSNIELSFLLIALPFVLYLGIFTEIRKFFIRHYYLDL